MVNNGPLYFCSKSKAIALEKWSKMDHSIFGQKVRLLPCKNGQKWTTFFWSKSKAIALQKWSKMDHFFFWSKSKALALQKWSKMDNYIFGQKVRL